MLNSPGKKLHPSPVKCDRRKDSRAMSLISISAKLAANVPPAEMEIKRLNNLSKMNIEKRRMATLALIDTAVQPRMGSDGFITDNQALETHLPELPENRDIVVAEKWIAHYLSLAGSNLFLLPSTTLDNVAKTRANNNLVTADDLDSMDDKSFTDFMKRDHSNPLCKAGIDRHSLYRLGIPKDLVERMYRALYVYTSGFHNLIQEIAKHCPAHAEKHLAANVWLTFLHLLEQCEDGQYKLAMLKFNEATKVWRNEVVDSHEAEVKKMQNKLDENIKKKEQILMVVEDKNAVIDMLAEKNSLLENQIRTSNNKVNTSEEEIRVSRMESLCLGEEIKSLLSQVNELASHLNLAQTNNIRIQSANEALEQQLEKSYSDLEGSIARENERKNKLRAQKMEIQRLKARSNQFQNSNRVLQNEKNKGLSKIEIIKQNLEKMENDYHKVVQEKLDSEEVIKGLNRQLEKKGLEYSSLKEQSCQDEKSMVAQIEKNGLVSIELMRVKNKFDVLSTQYSLLNLEKSGLRNRKQDKQRIDRLLNKVSKLNNEVEQLNNDKITLREQVYNTKVSLETIEHDLRYTKRAYTASRQAVVHSERTTEQMRVQLQEAEKLNDRITECNTDLKEKQKSLEETSKEKIGKLEMELKISMSQVKELSYNKRIRDNEISDFNKLVAVLKKDKKELNSRLNFIEDQSRKVNEERDLCMSKIKQFEIDFAEMELGVKAFYGSVVRTIERLSNNELDPEEAVKDIIRRLPIKNQCKDKIIFDDQKPLRKSGTVSTQDVTKVWRQNVTEYKEHKKHKEQKECEEDMPSAITTIVANSGNEDTLAPFRNLNNENQSTPGNDEVAASRNEASDIELQSAPEDSNNISLHQIEDINISRKRENTCTPDSDSENLIDILIERESQISKFEQELHNRDIELKRMQVSVFNSNRIVNRFKENLLMCAEDILCTQVYCYNSKASEEEALLKLYKLTYKHLDITDKLVVSKNREEQLQLGMNRAMMDDENSRGVHFQALDIEQRRKDSCVSVGIQAVVSVAIAEIQTIPLIVDTFRRVTKPKKQVFSELMEKYGEKFENSEPELYKQETKVFTNASQLKPTRSSKLLGADLDSRFSSTELAESFGEPMAQFKTIKTRFGLEQNISKHGAPPFLSERYMSTDKLGRNIKSCKDNLDTGQSSFKRKLPKREFDTGTTPKILSAKHQFNGKRKDKRAPRRLHQLATSSAEMVQSPSQVEESLSKGGNFDKKASRKARSSRKREVMSTRISKADRKSIAINSSVALSSLQEKNLGYDIQSDDVEQDFDDSCESYSCSSDDSNEELNNCSVTWKNKCYEYEQEPNNPFIDVPHCKNANSKPGHPNVDKNNFSHRERKLTYQPFDVTSVDKSAPDVQLHIYGKQAFSDHDFLNQYFEKSEKANEVLPIRTPKSILKSAVQQAHEKGTKTSPTSQKSKWTFLGNSTATGIKRNDKESIEGSRKLGESTVPAVLYPLFPDFSK